MLPFYQSDCKRCSARICRTRPTPAPVLGTRRPSSASASVHGTKMPKRSDPVHMAGPLFVTSRIACRNWRESAACHANVLPWISSTRAWLSLRAPTTTALHLHVRSLLFGRVEWEDTGWWSPDVTASASRCRAYALRLAPDGACSRRRRRFIRTRVRRTRNAG